MTEQTEATAAEADVEAASGDAGAQQTESAGEQPEVSAEPKAAKRPARRRAPRRDDVLAGAVLTARAGLAGLAEEDQIGEHLGATVDDDRLMTHRWEARLPGYRGWQWYSTVARAPRAKLVTVCEVGLAAGEDSIVAPAWVPYADRVSEEERERMRAVAEGRDPNRPAEDPAAATDSGHEAAPAAETVSAPDAEAPEAEETDPEGAQES